MDPISMITTALLKGAEAAAKGIGTEIIKNSYNGLKELVRRRFSEQKNPAGEVVLTQIDTKPEVWEAPLKNFLTETGADKDAAIFEAAKDLIEKLKNIPEMAQQIQSITTAYGDYSAASGAYGTSTVNVTKEIRDVQAGVVGNNAHVEGGVNYHGDKKK